MALASAVGVPADAPTDKRFLSIQILQTLSRYSHTSAIPAMTDFTESRAHYLREATHLLAILSPSASAFLGSARNKLLQDAEIQLSAKALEALRREICGACGNLMIPGWSCESKNKARNRKSRIRKEQTKAGRSSSTNPCVVYQCLRCQRKTEQTLQSQPRRHMKTAKSLPIRQSSTSTSNAAKDDEIKKPRAVNTSSKQRQKARKGGLQAMLDKNKLQNSSQGFDLMDFAM